MIEKRHGAASVIDENGNLWVLGGTYDSKSADSTEIYDYKSNGRGTWKQSYPLPGVLRDTGLDSHCAVRINSSHVFMAGGYARNYTFCDQLADDNCQEKAGKSVDGGGRVLKRAWMYNGETWLNLPSMSIPRDRPACSLIQLNDDSVNMISDSFDILLNIHPFIVDQCASCWWVY